MSIPIEESLRSSIGRSVRRWARLFLIELRRGQGAFVAAGVAAITAWVMWDVAILDGIVRWRDVSRAASDPLWITTTFVATSASWLAARDERRRIVDLVETTSNRQVSRDLASLMSVTLWAAVGYLFVVAVFFTYARMYATWGGPEWNQVILVVVSLAPAIMFGWLCGAHLKHRLTPLFVAVTLAAMHLLPVTIHNARVQERLASGDDASNAGQLGWERLMPVELDYSGELWKLLPLFSVWMLGMAGVFWGMHRILSRLNWNGIASVTLASVIAGSAAFALVRHEPVPNQRLLAAHPLPVCTTRLDDAITVCLHPEDQALLDETADVIASVVEPIAGLSGVYERYQTPLTEGAVQGEYYPVSLRDRSTLETQIPLDVVRMNVWTPPTPSQPQGWTPAQAVIGAWLLDIDRYPDIAGDGYFPPTWLLADLSPHRDQEAIDAIEAEIDSAIARFTALPPDEQRAWLETHWIALTSGALSLDDLP